MAQEIYGEDYIVSYGKEGNTITFNGILRLSGTAGYRPIAQFLDEILDSGVKALTLDLRELKLLNSSGITMLSKFVIHARQYPDLALVVKGSQSIFWQERSLGNLQRLLPSMELYLE
jgi:hypothetical protein